MCTSEDVQCIWGYHEDIRGYHEYIGGCSVHWEDIMMHVGGYYEYIGDVQYIMVFKGVYELAPPHES